MPAIDTDHLATRLEAARAFLADYRTGTGFVYYGDLPLGETWAFMLARHRDSDTVEQSNWHVIHTDMAERFPDDIEVVHCSHWAVGWIDHLAVRLLDDAEALTDAGHAILEWKEQLDDYPVADETDHSEREFDALWDNFEFDLTEHPVRDNLPDDWKRQVFDQSDPAYNGGDWPNEYAQDLRDALVSLGFLALSELEPVAYYDLGNSAFYRFAVELEDGECVWLTADCLLGRAFVKSSEDVPTSAVEITALPANVAESLEYWIAT